MSRTHGLSRLALAALLLDAGTGAAVGQPGPGLSDDYLWNLFVPGAIPYSVSISDTMDETWLGQGFADPRLTYLRTAGTGIPIYDYAFPDIVSVVVASAEDASLAVVATQEADAVTLYAFNDASGPNPLWTYTFPSPFNLLLQPRTLDVSDDGAFVLATAATEGPRFRIVRLDGATGALLQQATRLTWATWVELSADGSRALLNELARTEIIETTGLNTLFTYQVPGSHNASARLSRDGLVAATGGGDEFRAYRDTGAGWEEIYVGQEYFERFWAVALSGNGDTLFVASFYSDWLRHTYRLIDLVNGVELERIVEQGAGDFQDAVDRAEMSENGEVIAVISDGDQVNSHPELEVFDRDLNLIGSLDTPGSPYDMDMTRDGRYIVVGAKHVHWELPGSDGDAFAYRVPFDLPGDLNGDGCVDQSDLGILLADWGCSGGSCPGDCDFDGDTDQADLGILLANWGDGCG